jgi:hypothetical protein
LSSDATPSTITHSSPLSRLIETRGRAAALARIREPDEKKKRRSSQTPHTGRAWGVPAGVMVAIQKLRDRESRVSAHDQVSNFGVR